MVHNVATMQHAPLRGRVVCFRQIGKDDEHGRDDGNTVDIGRQASAAALESVQFGTVEPESTQSSSMDADIKTDAVQTRTTISRKRENEKEDTEEVEQGEKGAKEQERDEQRRRRKRRGKGKGKGR